MNWKPLYEKLIIKIDDKQDMVSKTGLTYNKNMSLSNNSIMQGIVVKVGNGRLLANGEVLPLIIKEGDKVLFSKMSGESYTDEQDDFVILSESQILAIRREENVTNN